METKNKLTNKEVEELFKEAYNDDLNRINYSKEERILKMLINVNQINIERLNKSLFIFGIIYFILFTILLILILVI